MTDRLVVLSTARTRKIEIGRAGSSFGDTGVLGDSGVCDCGSGNRFQALSMVGRSGMRTARHVASPMVGGSFVDLVGANIQRRTCAFLQVLKQALGLW